MIDRHLAWFATYCKVLFHIGEEILHLIFVNDLLLVRVATSYRVFNGFHHFNVVFTGACIGGTLSNTGVFRYFLCHDAELLCIVVEWNTCLRGGGVSLLDFAVHSVFAHDGVVFLQLQALRSVFTVLLCHVA